MGKEEHIDGPKIEPVYWDGDDAGQKHPVTWKRTWVRGTGQPLGFDKAVRIEYELQAHEIAEFPAVTKWFELLDDAARSDKGGWPERLKRGAGRASLDENPLIDASMGGPPTEFTIGSGVIEGLSDLVSRMRVGEEIEAWLHPRKGYHKDGNSAIPGNALLHFVSLRVEDFGNEEAGCFGSRGGAPRPTAAKGPVKLYQRSLLYPSAEFTKIDLSDDLVLNISGEDTPRPGWDRKQLKLHDKMFGAAEASEKRFRRRREALEKAEREGSLTIVERAHGVLRDAQYKPWRELKAPEKSHARKHGWTSSSWEAARKVGKAETQATLLDKKSASSARWKVDPTVASLMGREVVQTINKQADRIARDFQLFGSDQRFKSPYSDSVTELPAYGASIFSQTYWHGIDTCSGDLCLLAASYFPCCRVHLFGLPNDNEGRMRSCSCCGLDVLVDSRLPCTYHRCCVPYTDCSTRCLQDPHPNPRCICRNPLDLLHMSKQGEGDDEGRMGEIRNHALNFGTAKAKSESESEARSFISRQLALLSLVAQGLCVYTVFSILGNGEWRVPAIAADIAGLPEAHDASLWFIIGFWVLVGSLAARLLTLIMYYNPILEPALLHRRPQGQIEEIWIAFTKTLDDDAKESFIRDNLRNDPRVLAVSEADLKLEARLAGLAEIDRLKLEGNWFIEWTNLMEEAEAPLRAFFAFLERRSRQDPEEIIEEDNVYSEGQSNPDAGEKPRSSRWSRRLKRTAFDFVVHPYTLKVYSTDSREGLKLTALRSIDELPGTFPVHTDVRAWMCGSAFANLPKKLEDESFEERIPTQGQLTQILEKRLGLVDSQRYSTNAQVPCSLLWYVAHCYVKIQRIWSELDVYLDHKWEDMKLFTKLPEVIGPGSNFARRPHRGCCASGEDIAPTWRLLLDRRGQVYWHQVAWAGEEGEAEDDTCQHVPLHAVDPLNVSPSVTPADKRQLEFREVMRRFLEPNVVGGDGQKKKTRIELHAYKYIQLRYQNHDTEQEEDHSALLLSKDFVENYSQRLARKAFAYADSRRPAKEANFLIDFAEFRILGRWLQTYWGCTNMRAAALTKPSSRDSWFLKEDRAQGMFSSAEGTKRLELCRKALMYLHVQRTDRIFVDSEGRNVHDITPPTMGDAALHTRNSMKKGLASDLVRAEEDYRAIEDLFKWYRRRREFFEKFLLDHKCGPDQDDFPTTFAPDQPTCSHPQQKVKYPDQKLEKNWDSWVTKYKDKAPPEFKSPETLQLIYDIAFGEDKAIRSSDSRGSSGAGGEKVDALKVEAHVKEKELRRMVGGDEEGEDDSTEDAVNRLKDLASSAGEGALKKAINNMSIPEREFALAWAAYLSAVGTKKTQDSASGILKLKALRLDVVKAIRQESTDFKSRKTASFKKNVNRLWQIELQIAEQEIPHFRLDTRQLGEDLGATKNSRDVVWDALDEAVDEWSSLEAGEASKHLRKKLRMVRVGMAKMDKERKNLEEARVYSKQKIGFQAIKLFADACDVLINSVKNSNNPISRCVELLHDDAYGDMLRGDGAGGPAWLVTSRNAAYSGSDETLFVSEDDLFPEVLETLGVAKDGKSLTQEWSTPFGASADLFANSNSWENEVKESSEAAHAAWKRALTKAWEGNDAGKMWESMGGVKSDPLVCVSLLYGAVLKVRVTLAADVVDVDPHAQGAPPPQHKSPFQIAREQASVKLDDLDSQSKAIIELLRKAEVDGEELLRDLALWYKSTIDADLGGPDTLVVRLRSFAETVQSLGNTAALVEPLKTKYAESLKATQRQLQGTSFPSASGELVPVTALLHDDVEERLEHTIAHLKGLENEITRLEAEVSKASKHVQTSKTAGYVVGPISKKHRPSGDTEEAKKRYRKTAMQLWVCHLAALWQSDPRAHGQSDDEETRDRAKETWAKVVMMINQGEEVQFTDGLSPLKSHPTLRIETSVSQALRTAKTRWFRDDVLEDLLGSWTVSAMTSLEPNFAEEFFVSSPFTNPPKPYRGPPKKKPSEELALTVMDYLIDHSNGTCKGILEELSDADCATFDLKGLRRRVLKGYQKTLKVASRASVKTRAIARLKEDDPSVRALRDSADFGKVWEFVRCKMAVNGKGVRGATGDPEALSALLHARKTLLYCEFQALTLENQDRQQLEFNTDVAVETRRAYYASIADHEAQWSTFWEYFAEQLRVETPTLAKETTERLARAQRERHTLIQNDSDLEKGRPAHDWLERRPGAMFEDLIEEYSRASVSLSAVLLIWLAWIAFLIDPAVGLYFLDRTRLPPRANQRLEADLALYAIQTARGHAAAELQVTITCGMILALMICYFVYGGSTGTGPHSAFLFWLTASMIAAQCWRAFGATTRFLRVQREIMVGDAWARWLESPMEGGAHMADASENRWEGASEAVAQAAGTKASRAKRFHGDGFDVSLKYAGMFKEDELVREQEPKIMFDASVHPPKLCRYDRAFEFRGHVPDCRDFIEWDFEIQYEMIKNSTNRNQPLFEMPAFLTRLERVFSDGNSRWDAARWKQFIDSEVDDEVPDKVMPSLGVSVSRDHNELNADGDVTDFVRLKFCLEVKGSPDRAEWFQRIRSVLQQQMSDMSTVGLQFPSTADDKLWFRPRVYRWRLRAGAHGMTNWRPNIKPLSALN